MVAYSFNSRFRAAILSGRKRQTIRAGRKRDARPGEPIQLYTGMRTRHCALIAVAICAIVEPIRMRLRPAGREPCMVETPSTLSYSDMAALDNFARDDGFEDWHDLVAFWARAHPGLNVFSGVRIGWDLPPEPSASPNNSSCAAPEASNG